MPIFAAGREEPVNLGLDLDEVLDEATEFFSLLTSVQFPNPGRHFQEHE